MSTLAQLRSGLKARLDTISGLRTYVTMPAKPEPPAAAVLPRRWEYQRTFSGGARWELEIWVYVSPTDLANAQERFDQYMAPSGSSSVATAIAADPTLGLTGVYASVTGAFAYASMVDIAGSQLLGGALQVEILDG